MRTFRIAVNGKEFVVDVEEIRADPQLTTREGPTAASGQRAEIPLVPAAPSPRVGNGKGQVRAPIPGVVDGIRVRPGDRVAPGDVLVILEAMKMKNEILSPAAAQVKEVAAVQGGNVAAGDLLVVLE